MKPKNALDQKKVKPPRAPKAGKPKTMFAKDKKVDKKYGNMNTGSNGVRG